MSKKSRKRRRAPRIPTGRNKHHLLFQGRHWNTGMAKELRNFFIYEIPINIHNELHNEVLHDIPKPPPEAMKPLYLAFLAQRQEISQLDIVGASEWLSRACTDDVFCATMKRQAEFFRARLNKSP